MHTIVKRGMRLPLVIVMSLASAPAWAEWALNMPRGVTSFSEKVWQLHMVILGICCAIGVIVFGAMIVSMVKHRKSRGVEPAQFQHNNRIEALWTAVPFLILIVMAVPATSVLIDMERTGDAEMTVKVTGYQWRWQYEYLGEGVSLVSSLAADSDRVRQPGSNMSPDSVDNYLLEVDNRLVLPVDTKVKFLITAGDVVHAWWVPQFGWKRDAIPGFINEAWTRIDEPGVYRGQCAELCGKDHGFMPIVVEAVPKPEFERWLQRRKSAQTAQTGGDRQPSQS